MGFLSFTSTTTKTIDKSELIYNAIKQISLYEIKVGYPSEYKDREVMASDQLRRGGVHLTNPQIAYIMEYGDTKLNIPPRPSLIPGVDNAIPQILRYLGPALRAVINRQSPLDTFIDIGRIARNSARQQILFGDHEELAPATLFHRKEAGITLTIPLIETGRMRNALSYMVDLAGYRVYLSPKVREIVPASNAITKGMSPATQRLNLMRKVARNRIA